MSTATTAQQPVVLGECLPRGAHANAIGANTANRRELDDEAVRRASLIAVDSVEQAGRNRVTSFRGWRISAEDGRALSRCAPWWPESIPGDRRRIKSRSSNHTESPCGMWPSPALSTSRHSDIKRIFAGDKVDEIPSTKLCEALAQIETSPWGEWSERQPYFHGKACPVVKTIRDCTGPDRREGFSIARIYTSPV